MGPDERWRRIAHKQDGLITRSQLAAVGVHRWTIADRHAGERWRAVSPTVVATFTGDLSTPQHLWLAVLHGGNDALLSGLTAAEEAGLQNWHRDDITVLVPYASGVMSPLEGVRYVRSRRSTRDLRQPGARIPRCRLEPAVLLFAAADHSGRTAQGVLAATVQQRLTTPGQLREWVDRLAPLRKAAALRRTLADIEGGVQSVGELDVTRMCAHHGLMKPMRQVRRRDNTGRIRFTDCEWQTASGIRIVLEVDGSFHMDVEHWEADLARQRALTTPNRIILRCSARELRDEPERLARDLRLMGVPSCEAHRGL